jgi:hypothetical protein
MGNVRLIRLWCCVIGLAGPGTVAAVEPITDKELYDEGYDPIISSEPETEGSEEAVMLPSWPSEQDLVTVNLSLVDFPYTLLIDEKSLAVGKDRVIRYTAILRSAGGVDNIAYEGISCNSRQVRRYAYGSRGQFRRVRKPEWRFVLRKGQDRYRHELIESYFCPLPSGDMEHEILGKLKSRNPYR